MNLAVLGILADRVGSGAGTFPVLLRALLGRGARVDCFGMRGFNDPTSLEGLPDYRFMDVRVPFFERLHATAAKLESPYPVAAVAQVAHLAYQREAIRRIEAEHSRARYTLILCTDAQALARSSLPLACWPQSPPQTEGEALRTPAVARAAIQGHGLVRWTAVQAFYGYRWAVARTALDFSDLYLCGSRWARDEWARFGARPERLRALAYPIALDAHASTPPLGALREHVTFLWLGRAVPRKRLDLFLEGVKLLHERHPSVRARVVGNLEGDPVAARLVAAFRHHPAFTFEGPCPHTAVPKLLGEVDVLVQPSQNENFGFSVAESLAAGRAVVLGPSNGTADYAGEAGFMFSEYEAVDVARALERARDAVLGRGAELSAAARQAAREHFLLDAVAERFTRFTSDAVANRSARDR
jgi:glycosyltransferase involved in cell wall biosynthesis